MSGVAIVQGRGAGAGTSSLTPGNGNVKITQDGLGNTYDRVGSAYSNDKP
jgi:hypothetical protein